MSNSSKEFSINFTKNTENHVTDFELIIPNIPTYVLANKYIRDGHRFKKMNKEKYYLTANFWYGSTGSKIEGILRQEVKKKIMLFLQSYIKEIPKFSQFPLKITYIYCSKLRKYDLHNKCFFWAKLFEDYLVSRKLIPDDSIKYIQEEIYKYQESNEEKLIIKIQTILNEKI